MSDLNNQEKLEAIYKMTLQNHEILQGMRSRERLGNIVRIVYWLIILGAIGGVYIYVKPLLQSVSDNKSKVQDTLNQFEKLRSQFPETKAIQEFFNQMKSSQNTATDTSATSNQ
ncbi:MAG: hypothetical protein JWN37_895 [Candidatus Nomurabacteria bacterium]|nr:hypothetical protein [Candidatus Nomurabacteria bacterium]